MWRIFACAQSRMLICYALNMPKAEIRNVLLKLPVPLHTALKIAAARKGVTLAALMSEALQPLYAQVTATEVPK